VKESLAKLLELQKADHHAADAERRRADFDKQMDGVNKLLAESKAGVETAHKAVQRIADLNGKLGGATSNKEYGALLLEIGVAKAEIGRIEEQMLVAMDDIEAKEKLHEAAKAKLRETETIHRAAQSEVDGRRRAFEEELGAVKTERAGIAGQIPPEFLKVYDRIRAGNKRSGTAIVPVHGEYCQGCQMSITSQELSDLISGSRIVLCRSCQRILILEV
jgi:predicted  nucleic acid-binding Zn-ribbon protein